MRVFTLLCVLATSAVAGPLQAQSAVALPGAGRPSALKIPRIQPLPQDQRTEVHQQRLAKFPDGPALDRGFDTLLRLPALVDAVMPYTVYLSSQSTLSPRHRALLTLRAAWLCASEVVWSDRARRARADGLTTQELRRIAEGPDAPGWDRFEAALLRMTDELYRNSAVSNATWATLAASYDQHHLVDAVETVNHFTMLSIMYNAFGVQPDQAASDRLPADAP